MRSLFSRNLQLVALASGSSGNCTYVGDGLAGLLIDCGISTTQILRRLEAVGLGDAPIDAVLITHEHTDHVAAAAGLSRRLRKRTGRAVPFYMTAGTRAGLHSKVVPEAVEEIRPAERFAVRHLRVEPFVVPHDTRDPVAYRVASGGTWAGVITDLGQPTALVAEKLRSLSMAVLEFNHDVEMLLDGSYPWPLKQRIRSSHGHLSNDQACELLGQGLGEGLSHLVLGHLSAENNRPDKALLQATRTLSAVGHDLVRIQVARQEAPLPPISARVHDW